MKRLSWLLLVMAAVFAAGCPGCPKLSRFTPKVGCTGDGCVCQENETRSCVAHDQNGQPYPGECKKHIAGVVTTCHDNAWGECVGALKPGDRPEVCGNGLDDDCNGQTDENCVCSPGMLL